MTTSVLAAGVPVTVAPALKFCLAVNVLATLVLATLVKSLVATCWSTYCLFAISVFCVGAIVVPP